MTRIVSRIATAVAVLAAVFVTAHPAQARDFQRTCAYFDNVAFNDRFTAGTETFRMRLAADCAEALTVHAAAPPGSDARSRAEDYLALLQRYRQTLIDMASERYDRAQEVVSGSRETRYLAKPVTRSGEFLIAKVMGLLEGQGAWRAWRQAAAE